MERKERATYDIAKRCLDILGSIIALLISAPVFALASLLVRLDGGPVFFRQQRVGRGGREFTMFKLRTMVPNAQDLEIGLREAHAANGGYGTAGKYSDPRITMIGSLLRRSNLDELPQFLNILRGEMSLVGPRPVPYPESLYYGDRRDEVLSVRPGLTGYWQVKRRMSTDYDERIGLDCHYIRNRNPLLDAYILLMTPISMLTSDYNSVTKPLPPPSSQTPASEPVRVLAQPAKSVQKDDSLRDAMI